MIVNGSTDNITVRYKIKKHEIDNLSGNVTLPIRPAVKKTTELGKQTAWNDLNPSQYALDPAARTVTVSVAPGDALRIEHRNLVDGPQDDAHQAADFDIEEIRITGNRGEVNLTGEQARVSFIPESKSLYTITYR